MVNSKQFRVRFMDKSSNLIRVENDVNISGFRKVINGGLGDMEIELPMKFERSYTDPITTPFNKVEVHCIDGDTDRGGVLIYSGYVNSRNPHIDGSSEGVRLGLRGHVARFASLPLMIGNQSNCYTHTTNGTATPKPATSAALEKVFKSIIDQAQFTYQPINYTATSVVVTGYTLTYNFIANYISDALNTTTSNGPPGSYWYVGANNVFGHNLAGTKADHFLNFGSQIISWDDEEKMDGMINRVLECFNASTTLVNYRRDASVNNYGEWYSIEQQNYVNTGDAQNYATARISGADAPIRRLTVVVPDNNSSRGTARAFGYDIEKFEPGQMVKIQNLPAAVQAAIPDIMQIQSVDYTPDQATLELVRAQDNLARDYAQKIAAQQTQSVAGNPDTWSFTNV